MKDDPVKHFIDVINNNKELNSPSSAYFHALFVVRGRFEEGEDIIAMDASYSVLYAKDVLKGRFKLGEPAMKLDNTVWWAYKEFLLESEL